MPWRWKQSTGELYDPAGKLVERGYSGKGPGVNNPNLQHVQDTGPIPEGVWLMGAAVARHPRMGPITIPLTQVEGERFGRHSFFVHGDNQARNRSASSGCPIVGRPGRERMAASKDRYLKVEP